MLLNLQITPQRAARLLLLARQRVLERQGHPFHGNQYTKRAPQLQDPQGIYELGAVSSLGEVRAVNVGPDGLGDLQHSDTGMLSVPPSQRFRFVGGEIEWNDLPSKEHYFIVDDYYAKRYKNVTHTVFDGKDFVTIHESDLRDLEAEGHPFHGNQWTEGITTRTFNEKSQALSAVKEAHRTLLNLGFVKGDIEKKVGKSVKLGRSTAHAQEPNVSRTRYTHPDGRSAVLIQRFKNVGYAAGNSFTVSVHHNLQTLEDVGHPFHGNQYTDQALNTQTYPGFEPRDFVDPNRGRKKALDRLIQENDVTVYHGTASQALAAIKKDGLRPKAGRGGDAYAQVTGMRTQNWSIDDRPTSVFVTQKAQHALYFAHYAAEMNPGSEPVVLKIKLPKAEAQRLKFDEFAEEGDFRIPGVIKPEWIEGRVKVEKIYDPLYDEDSYKVGKTVTALARGDVVFYVVFLVEAEPRTAGEAEGHPFHGNQYTDRLIAHVAKNPREQQELEHQRDLAGQREEPLAHPAVIFGLTDMVHQSLAENYVAAYGETFRSVKKPDDVLQGEPNECYRNASLLVVEREDLTYAEGFATKGGTGLAILHAWAVDQAGNAIDNTLPDPENWQHFGVRYDRAKYLKYLYKAKKYGVLGSTDKNANEAIRTGGVRLR